MGMLELQPSAAGDVVVEAAFQPGEQPLAPARIGNRRILRDLGGGQEIVVLGEEIRLTVVADETEAILGEIGAEAKLLGPAEEIAVLPKCVRAKSLARIVGDAGADRPRLTLGNVDRHRYLAGLVRFVPIDDAHGIEEAALDERLAGALDFARIEASAALPFEPT